jgi:hypothetical protein
MMMSSVMLPDVVEKYPLPQKRCPQVSFADMLELLLDVAGGPALGAAREVAGRDMRRDFHENMHVIARQRCVYGLHPQFVANLADDLANPQTHFAMEHLEPIFGCPNDMIAMMKSRVTTSRVAHSL